MKLSSFDANALKRYFVIICLIWWAWIPLFSQIARLGTPIVKNFGRTAYQAGTQNWSIGQNDLGIMFFGNNKGLLTFDGNRWKTSILPNKTILRSFAFGENNTIYVGGQNELGYFDIAVNGLRTYTSLVDKIPEEFRSFEDIWKVFYFSGKIIFCSKKAIFIFDEEKKLNNLISEDDRFENFFKMGDRLIIQDLSKGLFEYNFKEEVLEEFGFSELLTNKRVVELVQYGKDTVAISDSDGLFKIHNKLVERMEGVVSTFLAQNQAYCATVMKDESLVIGTIVNGLIRIDSTGNILMHLNKTNGLRNNTILSVFEDVHHNLWLGLDNGIDYVEISSAFLDLGSESGIEGTGYAAYVDGNQLYVGTNQGLYVADLTTAYNSYENIQFRPVENSSGQVWSIQKIGDRIIVGRHEGATYLDNGVLTPFSALEGAWKFMQLKDHPEYAVEGTYTGFALYKNVNHGNSSLKDDWVFIKMLDEFTESARVFEQDREGYIWVSHAYKGLYRIKLSNAIDKTDEISFFSVDDGLPDSLFLNVVTIRNELVVTSPHGIYKFDHNSNLFVEHDELNSIFEDGRNVHRLLEVENGDIWFSVNSEFGILNIEAEGLLNRVEKAYFNHIQEDLVDGFEYVYALDHGHILIGTENGFVVYKPKLQETTGFPYNVLIRQISSTTGKDSLIYADNGIVLTEVPRYKSALNDLMFTYSAPYYDNIENVVYRYKLVGFENEWSEWSDRTEKEYTNLEGKRYSFEVQAKNAYGTLSEIKSFEFKILPPWYSSLVAKILYVFFGCILLFGLLRRISIREKKKTEAFKRDQEAKLMSVEREFKEETQRSENEIVRLKNEKLRADVLHKNSELAAATMHLVQKSEILLKLKSDIKQIAKDSPEVIGKELRRILRIIDSDIHLDENWDKFENFFDQVHENFFKRLRNQFPDLTPKDQKLCAYLRMNLTTKEIAPLLNISVRGVEISRYRLRKKLTLDTDVNLVSFIMDV